MDIPYTDIKVFVVRDCHTPGKFKDIILKIAIPIKYLKTAEYIQAVTYHFLTTDHLRDRWIKDDVYRFLGLYLRETQISKIKSIVSEEGEKIYIVLARDGESDMTLERGYDEIPSLTKFRIDVEKERWSQ